MNYRISRRPFVSHTFGGHDDDDSAKEGCKMTTKGPIVKLIFKNHKFFI